jgi:hypothetical protein
MPLFSNAFAHAHSPRVGSDSAPPSRPGSPTRSRSSTTVSSHNHSSANLAQTYPSRLATTALDATDLDQEPPSPAYGPYTPASDMGWSSSYASSGANTPGGYFMGQHHPVEIQLDADHLVMRGQGGDMNPAYLSGRVELELGESTNIREINMTLVGKAKVQFTDFTRCVPAGTR